MRKLLFILPCIVLFSFCKKGKTDRQKIDEYVAATNLHGDSIDLRDLLVGEQSTEVVTNGTPQIGNLLKYLDFAVTGAGATLQTTLHISSNALVTGGFNGTNASHPSTDSIYSRHYGVIFRLTLLSGCCTASCILIRLTYSWS